MRADIPRRRGWFLSTVVLAKETSWGKVLGNHFTHLFVVIVCPTTRVPPKAATAGKIAPRATCKEIAQVSTQTGQAVSCNKMSSVTRKL